MTISSSLDLGVADLAAEASRLAVTRPAGIADPATDGYQRMTADCAPRAVSAPSLHAGGGARTAGTRPIEEAGPLAAASGSIELAVQGRGMLPVTFEPPPAGGSAATRLRLTSTGAFRPDAQGVLRDAEGRVLLGWRAGADGTVPTFPRQSVAGLEAVRVGMGFAPGDARTMTTGHHDSRGALQTLHLTCAPTVAAIGGPSTSAWRLTVADGASGGAVVGEYDIVLSSARGETGALRSVTRVSGGPCGEGSPHLNAAGGPMAHGIGEIGRPGGLTPLADRLVPQASHAEGAPAGPVAAIEVTPDGLVRAVSASGAGRTLYRIPVVDVPNPDGLRSETGITFAVSAESGPFYLWNAGQGLTGSVEGRARLVSSADGRGEPADPIRSRPARSSDAEADRAAGERLWKTTHLKR